ncbi:MAG: hypothetical protein ACTSUV_00030 [Candidatus Ranarchaeia archaeon]
MENLDVNLYPECLIAPSLSRSEIDSSKLFDISTIDDENPLTDSEFQALVELGIESITKKVDFTASFQGLKRRLQIHQQKLVKALRRLEYRGLIKNNTEGYSLTPQGIKIALRLLKIPIEEEIKKNVCEKDREYSIENAVFSSSITLKNSKKKNRLFDFIEKLKGKWFGKYRFVGQAIDDDRAIVEFTSDYGDLYACTCITKEGLLRLALFKNQEDYFSNSNLQDEIQKFLTFLGKELNIKKSEFKKQNQPCVIDKKLLEKTQKLKIVNKEKKTKNSKESYNMYS